jgi:hypothetical protein
MTGTVEAAKREADGYPRGRLRNDAIGGKPEVPSARPNLRE